MTEPVVAPTASGDATGLTQALANDRRRPGRAPVNPALLPLLRGETAGQVAEPLNVIPFPEIEWEAEDAMGPARGLAFGLLLSLPIWLFVFFAYHEVAVHLAAHF